MNFLFLSFKLIDEDSGDDDTEDLLQLRQKSKEEKEGEEKDYKQWLKKEGRNLVRDFFKVFTSKKEPKLKRLFHCEFLKTLKAYSRPSQE